MSNEEIERKIEFIIQQQAQFASDVIELRQFQSENSQMLRTTVEVMRDGFTVLIEGQQECIADRKELREGLKELRYSREKTNAKIDALVDAQIRTDEQLKRTDEQQKRTDKQLKRYADENRRTSAEVRMTTRNVNALTKLVNQIKKRGN